MVLTVQAAEVAARTGDGEALGARMEVVQRLLLNGVNGQRTGFAIYLTDKYPVLILPTTAHSHFTIGNTAVVRA